MKVAAPATLSAVLGQVTYVINIIYAGQYGDKNQIAGMTLGHSIMQSMGIMVFLGFNRQLTTLISQAHGIGNLKLCGRYVNKAHWQNALLFIPVCLILVTVAHLLTKLGQSAEIAAIAASFIWATLPNVLTTGQFEIHKHQLNCYRLPHLQMLAQLVATIFHVAVCQILISQMYGKPILAIAIATNISSFFKLALIIWLGFCSNEIRQSYVSPWKTLIETNENNSNQQSAPS